MAQNIDDYQIKFKELVIGRDTPYGIRSVRGLFDVDVDSGSVPIPRGDGNIPGEDFLKAKNVEIELGIEGPKQSDSLAGFIRDIRETFKREDSDGSPEPLYFKVPGNEEQFIRVRNINIAIQDDVQSEHGLKPISVRLHAADPRLYGTDSNSDVLNIHEPDSGSIDFGLDFGLDFESAGLDVVIHNAGTAKAYPILRFFGPTDAGTVTGVTIINETTGQEIEIQSDILTDQILRADMPAYIRADGNQVIGIDGSSRYGDWQVPREPFYLQPGDNVLRYEITGTSAESVVNIIWFDTSI